jgi:hypothetical protein
MSKRRLTVLLLSLLGTAAAGACTDLNYDCAGVCGVAPGNGEFEGVVEANSLPEAIAACNQNCGCDAGTTPNCTCYLQQE